MVSWSHCKETTEGSISYTCRMRRVSCFDSEKGASQPGFIVGQTQCLSWHWLLLRSRLWLVNDTSEDKSATSALVYIKVADPGLVRSVMSDRCQQGDSPTCRTLSLIKPSPSLSKAWKAPEKYRCIVTLKVTPSKCVCVCMSHTDTQTLSCLFLITWTIYVSKEENLEPTWAFFYLCGGERSEC